MQEYTWLLPIIFIVIGGSVVLILMRLIKDKTTTDTKEAPKEIELTERFFMSKYLGGLPNAATPASFVYCAVTEDSFIFTRGTKGAEIGRIPRDAINTVIVGEKYQIAEQLGAQEKLYFGNISASKKENTSCLVLSWENSSGPKHNSVFEFYEQSSADSSAQALKTWMKQKQMTGKTAAKAS